MTDMLEDAANSIVRQNLLTVPGYSPYCGSVHCRFGMPRTVFDGSQFRCSCGWRSEFPTEFIERYRAGRTALGETDGNR